MRILHACTVTLMFFLPVHSGGQKQEPDTKTAPAKAIPSKSVEPSSEIRPSGRQGEESAKKENSTQTKAEERSPLWKDPVTSNWALVIVAVLAAFVAICTLRTISRQTAATEKAVIAAERSAVAADRTLEIMKHTAERQLRAYVLPTGGGRIPDKHYLGHFLVKITIKNTGQTPALKCTSCLGVGVSEFPIPRALPEITGDMGKSRFTLAPGEETDLAGIQDDITPQDLSAIQAGTSAIYAVGEILYVDIFDIARYTRFRLFCTGEWLAKGKFQFSGEGNEAN